MLKSLKSILLVLISSFLICSCNTPQPIKLVTDSKSEYAIVIPADPNWQELRAATLLQEYIHRVSQCKLPIVEKIEEGGKGIFIEENEVIKYDGFRINTDKDGSIYINGSKSKGCIYGVIAILDKYIGCHLYTPDFKIIPQTKDIQLPIIVSIR